MKLDALPTPIAQPASNANLEANPVRRLHLLIHTYAQTIRLISDLLIADLASHHTDDPRITDLVLALQRPAMGHWLRVLRELPVLTRRVSAGASFLPEWPGIFRRLEATTYPGCVTNDVWGPPESRPPLEGFLLLRNALSHGAAPPDDARSALLCNTYDQILASILGALSFFDDVVLYWLSYADGRPPLRLRGIEPEQVVDGGLKLLTLRRNPGLGDECVAVRGDRVLSLDPLVIGWLSDPRNAAEDGNDRSFLYDGVHNRNAYYVGAIRRIGNAARYEQVLRLLRPSLVAEHSSDPLVAQTQGRLAQSTLEALGELTGTKYFPEVFSKRRVHAAVDAFLKPIPRVSCMLLTGDSGSGKTSILCDIARTYLDDVKLNFVPALLQCKDLASLPERELRAGALRSALARAAALPLDADESWSTLVSQLTVADGISARGSRGILILLDALNEAPDPVALLRERHSVPVELEDVVEAVFVETKPALNVVSNMLLRLDCKPIARERPQEDPRQPLLEVAVDDLTDALEAALGRRHQCRHTVGAKRLADAPNPIDCKLPTVVARSRPVAVVDIGGAVERGRDVDVVLAAEFEHVLVEQGQICCNDEGEVLAVVEVERLGVVDDLLDQSKVQERLATLEFELDLRRRRAERELKRAFGCLVAHVVAALVAALTRHLAIRARVLTAERNDENVKPGELGQTSKTRARLHRKQLERQLLLPLPKHLLGPEPASQRRSRHERLRHQSCELFSADKQMLPNHIRQ
jgi:hypothetical protein